MSEKWEELWFNVASTAIFTIVGLLFFALSYWVIEKLTPFSLRKEIEEDQNIALGVILAGIFIAIALIVAAAARG